MKSIRVAKLFNDNKTQIINADYDFGGERLITSGVDDQIVIYDCIKGDQSRAIYSKKYGAGIIRFTHATNTVIHTSTKMDDTIRYLSLHDNKYLRYFNGHTKRVSSLAMSPTSDAFMSTSEDGTMRLWDLKDPKPAGIMRLPGGSTSVAAFDPEGLVFSVASRYQDVGEVKIYDIRHSEQGPFSSFQANGCNEEYVWTSLSFSPNGRTLMVCNSASQIAILDSFNGHLLHCFTPLDGVTDTGDTSAKSAIRPNLYMDASYSPDSEFVLCGGSLDGKIHLWDLDTDSKLCTFVSEHSGPVNIVKFNSKYMMIATARTELAFWTLPPSNSSTE